jgi:hypothetical protein
LDIAGKLIETFGAGTNKIDLQGMAPGIYMIKIQTNQGQMVERLVKK